MNMDKQNALVLHWPRLPLQEIAFWSYSH